MARRKELHPEARDVVARRDVAIISIAQQARPNVTGQSEIDRAQLTALSAAGKRVLDLRDLALRRLRALLRPEHPLALEARARGLVVAHDRQVTLQCQFKRPSRQM